MIGFNGGLIGARRVPAQNAGPGAWTLSEQAILKGSNLWINDPAFSNVSLLLHMDGANGSTTFTDSSANAFSVTANGNASISTAQSKFNGASASFDGSGDSLSIASPSTSLVQWYGDKFTLEYWIRGNAFTQAGPTNSSVVVGNLDRTGTTNYWSFGPITSGAVRFYYFNGSAQTLTTNATLSTNTWYHLALVVINSNILIFVDGQLSASGPVIGTPQHSTSTAFTVGQFNNVSFNGYIDEMRITNGTARYSPNYETSSAPFPNA